MGFVLLCLTWEIVSQNQAIATQTYSGTLESIQSSFVTLNGTLADTVQKAIKFSLTESAGTLSGTSYHGTLMRHSSTRFTVFGESVTDSSIVTGNYNSGTWRWDKLTAYKNLGGISSSASKTFTVTNNSKLMLMTIGAGNNCNSLYFVNASSSGSILIAEIKGASNITYSSSESNKLTVENSNTSVTPNLFCIPFAGNIEASS